MKQEDFPSRFFSLPYQLFGGDMIEKWEMCGVCIFLCIACQLFMSVPFSFSLCNLYDIYGKDWRLFISLLLIQ